MADIEHTANGPLRPASAEDEHRDRIGYTNPNLHRRVDISDPHKEIHVNVQNNNSYRLTRITHDEDTEEQEIP